MTHTASTLARGVLLGLAVTASIATSRAPGLDDVGENGLAAVHNGGEDDLTLRVTNPAGPLDCDLLERHPRLLSSIAWSDASAEMVLPPGRMQIPFEASPDGWTGWPTADCSAVRIDVEGVGERILFAIGEPDGSTPFFPVHQWVDASSLGEHVVSIVPGSPQEFRPTSPDLLFEIEDALPVCSDTFDTGPADCPNGLCITETVPGGVAFAYDGPETAEAATLLSIVEHEGDRDSTCTDLELAADAGRRTARFCAPDAAPALPFEPGDEVEVTYAWPWTGARLTITSASHTVVAASTTTAPEYGLRFEPARDMEPTCITATSCPWVGFDALDVSVVLGETAAIPGERVILPDVTPAREHLFDVDLALGSDDTAQRQQIVALWMDETRVSLSGNIDCGAPVDLLMVQSTRTTEP